MGVAVIKLLWKFDDLWELEAQVSVVEVGVKGQCNFVKSLFP